jgi:hypothetical protein
MWSGDNSPLHDKISGESMKRCFTLIMILLPLICLGITRQVALDGSQAYTSIQTAINDAVSGDMVLVYPGRYHENIDLSNKSNIILASLEYTSADTTYISTTIIDGSGGNSSTILCYENTNNCTISGLSITGGQGYDFYSGASPYQIFGGGIFIYTNNTVILRNLNIYENTTSWGGGVTILASNSVSLSGVNIYDNSARYRGGGLAIGSGNSATPNIIFDPINRCSIYNNFAQWGMDIDWYFINSGTAAVYLKKFTVPQWEKYYASYYESTYPPSPYVVFDIQESYLQPLDADLYVSPTGDDGNDGLSPATPIRTPSRAMQRIASNPQQPRTVHLLAGEHHNLIGGEYIPVAIKDYTTLQGVSEAETRLYGENMLEGTGVVSMGIESYGVALKGLSITTSRASAIFSWGVHECLIENVSIVNSSVDRWLFAMGYRTSTFTLKNITMDNNTGYLSEFGLNLKGLLITLDNITMTNNRTEGLPAAESDRHCGGFDIDIFDKLVVRNSKFVNNTHYSEDGTANFRVSGWGMEPTAKAEFDNCLFADNHTYGGARDINLFFLLESTLTNCTFANNIGSYPALILFDSPSNRIVNCLFSNNSAQYEIKAVANTLIENCLFTRTNNIYQTYNGMPLNWGLNNITGTDPLFVGTDPTSPTSYYLCADDVNGYSPAIDAGTMDTSILPLGYTIPAYDAFGNNRLYGNGIDIGCYESQGYTGVEDDELTAIDTLQLSNYPNPFNPTTTIRYTVPKDGDVRLCIYNTRGQLVTTLVNERKDKGSYTIVWNGKDNNGKAASSGVYFTRILSNGKTHTSKMLMVK